MVYFFFFQAEDGIRDVAVTGVQTCALPISSFGFSRASQAGLAEKTIVFPGRKPYIIRPTRRERGVVLCLTQNGGILREGPARGGPTIFWPSRGSANVRIARK